MNIFVCVFWRKIILPEVDGCVYHELLPVVS